MWAAIPVAALAVAAAVYLLFELLLVAVLSAAVATVVTLIAYRYLERRSQAASAAPEIDPKVELLEMLGSLLALNIRVREQSLSADVTGRVEGIIDKLRGLLEETNERHPGHELTWTLNQMAKQYLPKVMNPYLALSERDRDQSREELLRSLDGLEAEVDNVAELVRGDKMGDFKAKAAFLRARFVRAV